LIPPNIVIHPQHHTFPILLARSSIWALEKGLEPFNWPIRPFFFLFKKRENVKRVKVSAARKSKKWLESRRRGIGAPEHPAQSSDINPLEHV
jgi:hypothetical protein